MLGTIDVKRLPQFLPRRLQHMSSEMAKFGAIGVVNLFVNFAVFNLLWFTVLRNGELKAKAVATIVATTCAYFMNRHWTYRDRPKSTLHREYSLFIFFNAVGLVIEVAIVGIAKYGFDQTHIIVLNLCTGLGIVVGTIFRFWAYRTHVFKLGPGSDLAMDAEPLLVSAAAAVAAVPDPALLDDSDGHQVNGHQVNGHQVNGHTVDLVNGMANGASHGLTEDLDLDLELDSIVTQDTMVTQESAHWHRP